jgi:hypothetical protein
MAEFKLVAHSGWSKGGNGEYPFRYVVLRNPKKEIKWAYSVNEQIKDGRRTPSYARGHYDMSRETALKFLETQLKKNNDHYGPYNVSRMDARITIVEK